MCIKCYVLSIAYEVTLVSTMYYVLCTMHYVLCTMYYVLCTMYDALSIRYEVTLASTMQADAVAVKDSSVCARLHSAACQWVVGCLSSLSAM